MNRIVQRCLALALALGLMVPATVFATNGYFLIGFGPKSRSMGGVGVAYGTDALAAAANPATIVDVGSRVDLAAEFFNPPRSVLHDSAALGYTREKSGANEFLIPAMGAIYKFNRKMYMSMAGIGAGLGTRYNQEVPGNPTCIRGDSSGGVGSYFFNFNCNADSKTVGVMLLQMQMLPTVAYRITNDHTIGVSIAMAVQMFRAYGLGAFESLGFAATNENVSGEGNDWSYGGGARVGWMGKFFKKRLSLGANYASRVYMKQFDKYRNLFAEQGGFDIPAHYAVGMAFKVNKKLVVAADVQQILFSSIRSVNNPGPNAEDPDDLNPLCPGDDGLDPKRCKLGGKNGMGFGWKDMTVYKVGMDYKYNKRWNFRAGLNYGKAPIPEDQVLFNMLAPATPEYHVTLGFSYRPSRDTEISVNFMHAIENTIKGPTAFGPEGDPVVGENAAISMYQYSLGVSFGLNL